MALLIGLCNDRVPCISSFAVQGVSCLYEILLHRKGEVYNTRHRPTGFSAAAAAAAAAQRVRGADSAAGLLGFWEAPRTPQASPE